MNKNFERSGGPRFFNSEKPQANKIIQDQKRAEELRKAESTRKKLEGIELFKVTQRNLSPKTIKEHEEYRENEQITVLGA